MTSDEYLDYFHRLEIPPEFPVFDNLAKFDIGSYTMRHEINQEHFCWTPLAKSWTRDLASFIAERKVLEIMAGRGWLAKALQEDGVDITPTDDMSWTKKKGVIPVFKTPAIKAVKEMGHAYDILLVSWPPIGEEKLHKACKLWGTEKPIIYIGENAGGVTGCSLFFGNYNKTQSPFLNRNYRQFEGINDHIFTGKYGRSKK